MEKTQVQTVFSTKTVLTRAAIWSAITAPLIVGAGASAAPLDVSPIVTSIAGLLDSVNSVGTAALTVFVGIIAFSMIKRVLGR